MIQIFYSDLCSKSISLINNGIKIYFYLLFLFLIEINYKTIFKFK